MKRISEHILRLYAVSPPSLQNVFCSAEGLRIQFSRYGGDYSQVLDEVIARSFWSPSRVRIYQDIRIRHFLQRAVAATPYYRGGNWPNIGSWTDIRGIQDLSSLPVIQKQHVQEQANSFVNPTIPVGRCIDVHTSGTTGSGLHFKATRAAIREQWSVWFRYRSWHGISASHWCGYFGGRSVVPIEERQPPYWRINVPGRQVLFSTYHLSPESVSSYVCEMRRRRLTWLHGYPSVLSQIASLIVEQGIELGYEVKWITTGAESLLPFQRAVIRRAFGVEPREHYGMAEGVANFSECPLGRLHVDEDFSAVEFLATSDPQLFRVVGTNLSNWATPLVRYEMSDLAKISDASCPCGRPGRIVDSVDGRKEDYVVLRDGSKVGRMDHIFKDMVRIRESQIVQRQPGVMVFRIVRGEGYSIADERLLNAEVRARLGDQAEYTIEYVEKVPRTAMGKLRLVVSSIDEAILVKASPTVQSIRDAE